MHPNAYSLVHAAAAIDKPAINVVFSTPTKRVTKQFPFFPSFYLPHTSTTPFQSLLQSPAIPKHQLIIHSQSMQVVARDFSELKKIAFALFTQTNYFPLLIEPERQFLLTQKWRYFQSFDETFKPLSGAFADAQISGVAEPIYATLKSLHSHNKKMQAEWNERIACAHELLHPITEKLLSTNEKVEMELDNLLFQRQIPLPIENTPALETQTLNIEQREHAKARVLNNPLHAEGKCSCCTPQSFMEAHVLPQSRVQATATQDGIYIHTRDTRASETYHTQHIGKERREARAAEYGLSVLPIGPLSRNETITLPLGEAIEAMRVGNIKITFSPTHAMWKCRNQAFTLQHVQHTLHERTQLHAQQQNALLQPYVSQFQLYYTQFASQDPRVQLHAHAERIAQLVQENMAWHLIRGETKWRSETLIQGIHA